MKNTWLRSRIFDFGLVLSIQEREREIKMWTQDADTDITGSGAARHDHTTCSSCNYICTHTHTHTSLSLSICIHMNFSHAYLTLFSFVSCHVYAIGIFCGSNEWFKYFFCTVLFFRIHFLLHSVTSATQRNVAHVSFFGRVHTPCTGQIHIVSVECRRQGRR